MSTANDIRHQVTAKIVDALEAGTPPWRRPWRNDLTNAGTAANAASGVGYRGVNALLLGLAGYESRWWATYAQVQAIGFDVPAVPQPKDVDVIGRQWTASGEDKPTRK